MTEVKIGQRWRWVYGSASDLILEVTNIETEYNHRIVAVIVHTVHSRYPEDIIGREFKFEKHELPTSKEWTYLEGQDKPL